MKYKDCCDDLSNIEIQIKELQLQKKEYETAKKNVIENLTHEYSDNISKIDTKLKELNDSIESKVGSIINKNQILAYDKS